LRSRSGALDGAALAAAADTCRDCHADAVAQWRTSAHAFASFNNPAYRVSVEAFRRESGAKASRVCAGCHDPALLIDGAMDGATVPMDARASAGVGCLLCHSVEHASRDGNGSYRLRDDPVVMPMEGDAASLRAHRERLAMPALTKVELCASCHRAFLGEATGHGHHLPGADDYSGWISSAYAGSHLERIDPSVPERDCAACHMKREAASLGDRAAKGKKIASHRFTGGHTWLAAMRGDDEQLARTRRMLASAATVDVAALRYEDGRRALPADGAEVTAGAKVDLEVVIRNRGVGHRFPGGTLDAHDTWLELEAVDALGNTFASAGVDHTALSKTALSKTGRSKTGRRTDPSAHLLHATMVDSQGERVLGRRVHAFRAKAYDNTIAARDRALISYRMTVPAPLRAEQLPIVVRVRLLHRSRERTVADDACRAGYGGINACIAQPITLLASTKVLLGSDAAARNARTRRQLAQRMLDHGAAWLHALPEQLEQARASLLLALESLSQQGASPQRQAEVLLELARLEARQGRVPQAERWLARIGPEVAAAAWLRGRTLASVWQHRRALPSLEKAAAAAPLDFRAWVRLATAQGAVAEVGASLVSAQQGLRFAPRHPDLLRVQALALGQLALGGADRDAERAAALHAFTNHRRRDDAPALRTMCSDRVVGCALERTPVHRHEMLTH
jgi:hypothetical protein